MQRKIKAIGVYKVPALWDQKTEFIKTKKFTYETENVTEFNEHKSRVTSILDNIYFNIFVGLIESKNISEAHYIFVDESRETNTTFECKGVNVWVLKTCEDVMDFNDGDYYFVRGKYANLYDALIPEKAFVVMYPATSFAFHYNITNKIIQKRRLQRRYNFKDHSFYKKIDILLCHEDEMYERIYGRYSKLVELYKYGSDKFSNLNLRTRYVDFIFVADATQHTKNHQLMFDFMNYCENKQLPINFIYVSVKDILKKRHHNFIDRGDHITIEYYENISPDDLNVLFNMSRINLCFSGRDAVPRTISESLCAGCFNIALDTLSDGKFYYNGVFGEIIGDPESMVKLGKSRSLSYIGSEGLWKKILQLHSKSFDHKMISESFQVKYNLQSLMSDIKSAERSITAEVSISNTRILR